MNCLTVGIGCLIFLVILGISLTYLILNAPEGYQENGRFFYGEQKK